MSLPLLAGVILSIIMSGGFRLPEIPSELKTPEERTAYLAVHYWDNFDFADASVISLPEITEQAFVDFIGILPYASNAQAAVDTLICRASSEKEMLHHFMSLGYKYLYEPGSPMRDDGLLLLMLDRLLESPRLDESDKATPRYLRELVGRNRPGKEAEDFAYIVRDGERRLLSDMDAEYVLLYLNDPDCAECRRVKWRLSASQPVRRLLETGRLSVLSVCVEGRTPGWERAVFPTGWTDGCDEERRIAEEQLYDLRAMPALYLLDAERRVLLKDATVEDVEAFLRDK